MVKIHLLSQSKPIEYHTVLNTYTKDGLFCVYYKDELPIVHKYPLVNIFRVEEEYD